MRFPGRLTPRIHALCACFGALWARSGTDGATRASRVRPQWAQGIVLGTGCKFGRPASASAAVSGTNVNFYALACGFRAAAEGCERGELSGCCRSATRAISRNSECNFWQRGTSQALTAHVERKHFTIRFIDKACLIFPLSPGFESPKAADTRWRGCCCCSTVPGRTLDFTHTRSQPPPQLGISHRPTHRNARL